LFLKTSQSIGNISNLLEHTSNLD